MFHAVDVAFCIPTYISYNVCIMLLLGDVLLPFSRFHFMCMFSVDFNQCDSIRTHETKIKKCNKLLQMPKNL